jgi:plasmid maintenance system antidote protein VapI
MKDIEELNTPLDDIEWEEWERRKKPDRRVTDEGPPENMSERRSGKDRRAEPQTTIEFGGMSFTGGRAMVLVTALSSLGGATWAGFEFYKDYMDMREVVQNIDTTEIENRNKLIEQKLEDALDYSRDIKNDLRDQINVLDANVRRVEKLVRESEQLTREIVQNAEERFDNKRDALQNQYDSKASQLRDTTDQKIKNVENRLNEKLQRALDNPLAN